MKKLLMILLLALLTINVSCGGGGSGSSAGTSLVTITVGDSGQSASLKVEKNTLFAQAKIFFKKFLRSDEAVAAIPSNVNKITFTISASDMATMTKDVLVQGQASIRETFSVPNGRNRYFLVEAKDINDFVSYSGNTTTDLDGTPINLSIYMTASDTTPPTVISTSPANNETGVPVTSIINITFSESIDTSTFNSDTFSLRNNGSNIEGEISFNGAIVTFRPSANLAYSTTYTGTITTGVKDSAGNPMTADYSWTFTTGAAPDTTSPTVTGVSPGIGATDVSITTTITATFSEAMDASTINTTTFTLVNGGSPVSGTVTYTDTTATFIPSGNLNYSTTYNATITTGVKDLAGNAMASDYSWAFTTGTAPPFVGKFPIATTAAYEISSGAASDGTNYLVALGTSNTGSGWTTDAQLVSQSGMKVGSLIQSGCSGVFSRVAFDGTNYLLLGGDCDTWTYDNWGIFISPSGTVGSKFSIIQNNIEAEVVDVAYGGESYLVAWEEYITDSTEVIYGQLVSKSATLVGSKFIITGDSTDQASGAMAFDGVNFLVVWSDGTRLVTGSDEDIYGRFVSPSGGLSTARFLINQNNYPSDNPMAVAFDGTNYLVVWTDEVSTGEWDVFGQRVDTAGNLVGGVINISTATGTQFYPRIAFDGTNYLVTWTDLRNDANHNRVCDSNEGTCLDIYGQYISKTGTLVGSEFVINNDAGSQLGGVAGFNNGKYLVIINDGTSIYPPGCTSECSFVTTDVYGVFVMP